VHRASGGVELVERTSNIRRDHFQQRGGCTTELGRALQINRTPGEYFLRHPRKTGCRCCGFPRPRRLLRRVPTTESQTDGQEMEGVIKGRTCWFGFPSYGLPVIALGSGPSEAVKAVPDFLLMIAHGPGRNGIVMLDMGMGEVGT